MTQIVKMGIEELKAAIVKTVENSEHNAFFRSDFAHLGATYRQIGKALKELTDEDLLRKVGQGIYAKTEICEVPGFEGKRILTAGLTEIAPEVLKRLGYQVVPSTGLRDYNAGRSTQVPTGRRIGIKGKKTNRKIYHRDVCVTYEYFK